MTQAHKQERSKSDEEPEVEAKVEDPKVEEEDVSPEGAPVTETPESPLAPPAASTADATVADVEAQQSSLVEDSSELETRAPEDYGTGSPVGQRPWVFAPPAGS